MLEERLDQVVLALLFASEDALSARKMASVIENEVTAEDVQRSIGRLTEFLVGNIPSIRLERVGGGFQLVTNTEYAEFIARLYSGRRKQRLSKAAMETLAIITYKQPITRADMENVRGVGCGGVITTLMERSLIRIMGKAKVLGAPFLYGTTQEFLEYLGLNSIKDIPSMEELEELMAKEIAAEQAADAELEAEAMQESADSDLGAEDAEESADTELEAEDAEESADSASGDKTEAVNEEPGSVAEEDDDERDVAASASVEPFDMPGTKSGEENEESSEQTTQTSDESYEWQPPETSETNTPPVKVDDKD